MRRGLAAVLLLAALAAPVRADGDRVAATLLPTCSDGEPFLVFIVDASADDDCDSTGGGTTEAPCLCLDGAYVAMLASGGGGAPTNADYLVKTANGSLSAERVVTDTATVTWDWSTAGQAKANATDTDTKITLDLGDDGGNDSTGLTEIAIVNDTAGAFTEPSADKLKIDVSKLRPASFENPPASPHAYDDEFNTTSLDAKWTIGSSGTTNAATTGAIDYTASLTTPIVDAATIAGRVAFQSDNSTGKTFWIRQTYSAATDATFFFAVGSANRNVSSNGESNLVVRLTNSGDANEAIVFGTTHNASGLGVFLTVINNGSAGSVSGTTDAETKVSQVIYIACWKKSDAYHLGVAGATGAFDYIGTVTKTGVTTFDQLQVEMTTANEVPSIVEAVGFFRYKASLDYGLVNN